jgi:hypothetical protein
MERKKSQNYTNDNCTVYLPQPSSSTDKISSSYWERTGDISLYLNKKELRQWTDSKKDHYNNGY